MDHKNVFARRGDDENLIAQRARVLAIPALMRCTRWTA